jgi:hypothetical protein
MTNGKSGAGTHGETAPGRGTSRAGSFGRAMGEIEPRRLSESDLAYLRFIFLALQTSIKEVRYLFANRALVLDVFNGIDLLIENAGRRFGFPLLSPGQVVAPAPPKTLAYQLSLEATPPAAPTLNVQRSTFNAQRSTLNVQRSTFNAQRSMLRLRELASARNQPQ